MIRLVFTLAALLLSTQLLANPELSLAAKDGDYEKVKELIASGADVNALNPEDGWKRTPLMQASRLGHSDIVKLLLENGADVTLGDVLGNTPLKAAAHKGHLEAVKALLSAGAAPNENTDFQGRSPLLMAIVSKQKNAAAIVEALLKAGADSNVAFTTLDESTTTTAAQFAAKAGPEVEAAFKRNAR